MTKTPESIIAEIQNIVNSDRSDGDKNQSLRAIMYPQGTKSVAEAKIGDVIVILNPGRGYGGHTARIEVTKINKKTVKGAEIQGSYNPKRPWTIYKDWDGAFVSIGDTERLNKEKSGD